MRAGVAPDHPKIKAVTRVYEKTAAQARLPLLRRRRARRRTSRARSCSSATTRVRLRVRHGRRQPARHPRRGPARLARGHRVRRLVQRPPRLRRPRVRPRPASRAVVIGNGNVAIDVARMLVLDPDELAPYRHRRPRDRRASAARASTRSCCSAAAAPRRRRSRTRSCASSASCARADVIVDPRQIELDAASASWPRRADRQRRNVEILRDYAAREPSGKSHRDRAALPALAARDPRRGRGRPRRPACASSVNRHRGRPRASPTGEEEVIECGLVLRSIGYRGRAGRRRPVRRAPRPDPQRRRPRHRRRRRAAARRVRGRLDQARPDRRDRHQQEGRGRHRRAASSRTRGRARSTRPARRPGRDRGVARRARARRSSPGRAGRRSTRTSPRPASPPAARA